MIGIYCIRNSIDGKRYIGQSVNIKRRIKDHKCLMKKGKESNRHLNSACQKYGYENFYFSVLAICGIDELDKLERGLIEIYNTMNDEFGYNLTNGGNSRKEFSEETRKLLSEKSKGRPCSQEAKRVLSEIHKGNKYHLGRKMPEEARRKLSEYWKGKPQSKELVEKRSKALLERGRILRLKRQNDEISIENHSHETVPNVS